MDEYKEGLEELKVIKEKCISFINSKENYGDKQLIKLYKKRDKIIEEMDKIYNNLEKYSSKDDIELFKNILKYNSTGTYENLKKKLEHYARHKNISYENLLLKLKFKGVIDKGSINGTINIDKIKGHKLKENEKEKIFKTVLTLQEEGYNYCFCCNIKTPEVNAVRYINIFKYEKTYLIFGSSCIVEVPLLMKDNYKNIKIKKHLEKLKDKVVLFYNEYSNMPKLSKAKLKYKKLYKELEEIKKQIQERYNELLIIKQQQQLLELEEQIYFQKLEITQREEKKKYEEKIKEENKQRLLKETERRKKKNERIKKNFKIIKNQNGS